MAEQEKEATLFFKSESDQSADETEKSLNQVSSILRKELEEKPVVQEESTVEEKSQENPNNVMGDFIPTSIEIKETTSVDKENPDAICVAKACAKEIPQEVATDCSPVNNSSSADEKMNVDPEIQTEINKQNEELDSILEQKENISVMDTVGIDNDSNSSDSDVALRLSDSEDEKEKERPKSKMESDKIPSTEKKDSDEQKNIALTETVKKKPIGFEICDMSSDSETEVVSNCKSSALEKKDVFSDKKLAMLRRRGLIDVANIKPRLSGSKNEIIDLDEDVRTKQSGVMDLMQRFIKHSSKKKPKVEKKEMELR